MGNLKKKLKENELTVGTWVTINHPAVIEILSTAGFEWITLDIEHSAINIESVQNLLGHVQGNSMEGLVRVSKNEEVVIKRVMDAGADGVIVPMVKNKEEAEKAVSYVKYPPAGKRGVGLSRAQKFGTDFNGYKKWTNSESVVIAQIEHIEAVKNLKDILRTAGIDGIIVGPYDLSASMGYPGEYHREEVKQALNKIVKVTKELGKPLGFHVVESDYIELQKRLEEGYTFLAFSLDFFFLGDKAREEMAKFKKDYSL